MKLAIRLVLSLGMLALCMWLVWPNADTRAALRAAIDALEWSEFWPYLAVYMLLLLWSLVIAKNAKDGFGAMLAVGVTGLLFWPALLNVSMVLGLAPVIGVPLPFVSYGGTSIVANFAMVALLLLVSNRAVVTSR